MCGLTKINIKPLSVNKCWQGRRFKTNDYKDYELELLSILPNIEIPKPPFAVIYVFGVSSKLSDIDNPVKPFQDILQKKYLIDNRDILKMNVTKELVKKGNEFIEFEIKHINLY